MLAQNLRNVPVHSRCNTVQSSSSGSFVGKKCEHRRARTRHARIRADQVESLLNFGIDPYRNRLQVIASGQLRPTTAELLRKRRNFQGFRVSCQGRVPKDQCGRRGLAGHQNRSPGFGHRNGSKHVSGALRKGILSEDEKGYIGTQGGSGMPLNVLFLQVV